MSGCILTDRGYSNRLRDLLEHTGKLTFEDLKLLRLGRHFRIDDQTKLIIGRNEKENKLLDFHKRDHHFRIEALDCGSPVTPLIGNASEVKLNKAASLTVRYSSARDNALVTVSVTGPDVDKTIAFSPAAHELSESLQPVR